MQASVQGLCTHILACRCPHSIEHSCEVASAHTPSCYLLFPIPGRNGEWVSGNSLKFASCSTENLPLLPLRTLSPTGHWFQFLQSLACPQYQEAGGLYQLSGIQAKRRAIIACNPKWHKWKQNKSIAHVLVCTMKAIVSRKPPTHACCAGSTG